MASAGNGYSLVGEERKRSFLDNARNLPLSCYLKYSVEQDENLYKSL